MTPEIFLYCKDDCHPCMEMRSKLQQLLSKYDGCLCHVIKVESDPELMQRYGARVPVLVAGNRELCQFELNEAAVESYLDSLRVSRIV